MLNQLGNCNTYAEEVEGVPNPANASAGERDLRLATLVGAQAGREGAQKRGYSHEARLQNGKRVIFIGKQRGEME